MAAKVARKREKQKKEEFLYVTKEDHDTPCGNTYATNYHYWLPNGQKHRTNHYSGKRLVCTIEYKKNSQILKEYHYNGTIKSYTEYSGPECTVGNMTGIKKSFRHNGQIYQEGQMQEGYPVGIWRTYKKENVCLEEVYGEKGAIISSKKYKIEGTN